MAIINRSFADTIEVTDDLQITAGLYPQFYGTIQEAESYFQYRLDADAWQYANRNQKIAALVQSTNAIDRLGFIGAKTEGNTLEFPRDFQESVPQEIRRACYENALKLLDGVEPDTEIDNLQTTSRAYGGVRTTFDRGAPAPHIVHGLASGVAWRYLQPYLNDGELLVLKRGS